MAQSGIYPLTQLHDNKFHKEIVSSLEKSSISLELNKFLQEIKNINSHQNYYNIDYFALRIEHIQLSIKCLLIGYSIAFIYLFIEIVFFNLPCVNCNYVN